MPIEDIATKFFEHFLMIAGRMTNLGGAGPSLWDDEDNFFYDWLIKRDGEATPLRVRSLVGLIPLFAVEVIEQGLLEKMPTFIRRRDWYLSYRPDLAALVARWNDAGRRRHPNAGHRPRLPVVAACRADPRQRRVPV